MAVPQTLSVWLHQRSTNDQESCSLGTALEAESHRVTGLEKENLDLKITNRGKDLFIEQLTEPPLMCLGKTADMNTGSMGFGLIKPTFWRGHALECGPFLRRLI
jgi:hypothetical protein